MPTHFAIDDLVVYPAQGVGKVERIETQEIGGVRAEFYIVRILSNNVTLMVPVLNALNVGLRAVCSRKKAQSILKSLEDRAGFTGYSGQNWNRRYREYSEKLKSQDLADVAYVLKELLLIGKDKELSFGEHRLLEQAMGLLTLELAHALGRDQDSIRTEVEAIFADVIRTRDEQ
ncbi:CarD family transcriptional regulator [Desulfocurvus sp.]|uniref:CarD family transcriptional regulator n=1 Tax=Desulfocurvus sp. TaxID=2871698 RepID=UPI0025C17BF8|nr:CarD family transcriptional regulator [Desulfocurvus sp.]MCK9240385.1 CarD family transcriptional regulator [Desulfocurvus sp.]